MLLPMLLPMTLQATPDTIFSTILLEIGDHGTDADAPRLMSKVKSSPVRTTNAAIDITRRFIRESFMSAIL
jgi:hypothetical protein